MTLAELIKGVQFDLDDPDGTWADDAYVLGFVRKAYKKLATKLRLTESDFDERIIELPSVIAGAPDLGAYQAAGKPLESLMTPTMVEWKLPGQDASYYRAANGPLDKLPDVPAPGQPALPAWGFIGNKIVLAAFSTALDLRVTGVFLPDPMVQTSDVSQLPVSADVPLQTMLALACAEANGRDKLKQSLALNLIDELDDVRIEMTKAQQGVPARRIGRMNRRFGGGNTGIIPK
jgi:hypothetical protein